MSKKNKLLILVWFIFSWGLLLIFGLKPIGATNTIKLIFRKLMINIKPPQEIVLCDFETQLDLLKWQCSNAIIEQATAHASRGRSSAKVTYYPKGGISSVSSEDYNLGFLEVKDWSFFKFCKLDISTLDDITIPLCMKIKDIAGRVFYDEFYLKKGSKEIIFDLGFLGQSIDLSNIIYLNLFFVNPDREIILYLDNLRLERDGLKEKRILNKPIVELVRFNGPAQVKKGSSATISAWVSISQPLRSNYRAFIHISNSKETNKRFSQRRWHINADRQPWVETSKWQAFVQYEIGPVSIFIPKNFPPGEYIIQMGLFNPASSGGYYKGSSSYGAMDFRTSFPRLRYTNSKIKNYIVGKIKVLD